jgi:hypothetical protein
MSSASSRTGSARLMGGGGTLRGVNVHPGAGLSAARIRALAQPEPAWISERERAVPVDVPFDRVLIDTPALTLFVAALVVYPSGFCFTISSQLRPEAPGKLEQAFVRGFTQDMRHVVAAAQAESSLRLGVRFADGRRAVLGPHFFTSSRNEPDESAFPLMRRGRMSCDDRAADYEVWVMGLPVEGDVELFYRWLDFDVPETSVEIDGDALRAASAGAVTLWDFPVEEEPPAPTEPPKSEEG